MKKVYIIAGIMIAVAVSLFVMAQDDLSTYATISQAVKTGSRVKIAGQLAKDMEMIYDPVEDPNLFTFYIRDDEGATQKVVLLQPKPQDFELSEQVVLTGRMQEDAFVATDVLMKCPSKYKDEEIYLKEQQG
ncbi:cytochrome c maturation protein CcmE [Lewinella cohaerens]|uniref:cytochrome c maturation protein CcmE domain-containing protein n=1 Tax=Lewinella cohaerens TaxID=70995 RepID=UPI000376D1CC|nr:cytochrome c maturation protein CcmE [Lewinella cohaerens]